MLEIKPNGLYSRMDLAAMLEPAGVDVDHFIGRLKPRKIFKMLWSGEDLLNAIRHAPALAERSDPVSLPALANRRNRQRRGEQKVATRPCARLETYLQSLKDGQR